MKKSKEYLEEALAKMGEGSNTKKAEQLKVSKQSLSDYLNGKTMMDDFACIMVAKTLNIDPMEIIAAVQMEREKNEERRDVWADFRKKIGVLGLAGLIGAGTIATPSPAQAMMAKTPSEQKCTLCQIRGKGRRQRSQNARLEIIAKCVAFLQQVAFLHKQARYGHQN